MNSKKLIVITEGGKNQGFGHITRTVAIATSFVKNGYGVSFIINGDESVRQILNYPNQIFNWLEEKNKLLENIKDCDLILLDSILIENKQIKELEFLNIPIVFIDDDKHRNILDKGFVVDWTIQVEKNSPFIYKKGVKYFLGSSFTPLRDEFISEKPIEINLHINKIMVTFGGSDIRNLTPKVLNILAQKFPNFKKDIIIGAGFNNSEEIQKYADKNTNLIINATSKEMINSMKTSDIAIAAGGQTLYELAKIGLPTIGILIVNNARADTFGWRNVGFLKYIGEFDDIRLEENLLKVLNEMMDPKTRLNMQQKGLKYIGKNGVELLTKKILKELNDTF